MCERVMGGNGRWVKDSGDGAGSATGISWLTL